MLVAVPLAAQDPAPSPQPGGGDPRAWSELIEETVVQVALIDVEVRDKQGRPIPGLTAKDFEAFLDGKAWQIDTVDDLCPVVEPGDPRPPRQTSESERPTLEESPAAAEAGGADDAEPMHYVLYLDFSLLQQFGRDLAFRSARGWLERSWVPGDPVMIAGHTWQGGLRVLTPFTSDHDTLLRTLAEAERDPALYDEFPSLLRRRVDDCRECCLERCKSGCGVCKSSTSLPCYACCAVCTDNAYDEYRHGKAALEALTRLLVRLDNVPGRKQLLFFQENGALFPGRFYFIPDDARVPDQTKPLEQIGAEATQSRTTIHGVFVGPQIGGGSQGVNLGANLAQFTGGTYNRGESGITGFLDRAGRGPQCIYRVGLTPPEASAGRIHKVRVAVLGRELRSTWRVRLLTRLDRWLRDAQQALRDPGEAQDVSVVASLVPVSFADSGWEAAVRVAVPLEQLTLVPAAGRHEGGWEAGALLSREGTKDHWEMLAVSRIRTGEPVGARTTVVHQHTLSGLEPGSYRLGAFVRDQKANVFGSSRVEMVLPKKKSPSIVGPILLIPDGRRMSAPLPPLRRKDLSADLPLARPTVGVGEIPVDPARPVAYGDFEALSFVCPGKREFKQDGLIRFVSRDGTPLFRFETAEPARAGACRRLSDLIEIGRLEPGTYTYHLRWNAEGSAPDEVTTDFVVGTRTAQGAQSPTPATLACPDEPQP